MENTMDKQVMAEHHKNAAMHHGKASQCHSEAATHCAAGNHEKAAVEATKAHGHTCCALEHAKEASKCCVEHTGCCD
jgi:hypothetical protein